MNEEERQRKMDFILEQQAQFTADMQQLREVQAQAERRWASNEERWASTEQGIYALLAIAEIHEREIVALREHSRETDERMRETNERMKETDERINALVNTVERIISERRNGKG